ncbi:MAG: F0F1 ATP synthase subunit A [Patescibacteria group bacterium]
MQNSIHISLKGEPLFQSVVFPFTNSLLLGVIVVGLLFILGLVLKKKLALVPGTGQSITETGLESLLGLMDSVLGNRHKSERYLPLIATIFVMVMTANWLGLLPGVGSIGIKGEHGFIPFFRAPSADLNFTLAIAIISVVATHILAIKELGVGSHAKKFFNFSSPILFFVGILELVSEFAKIVSFSFRLFGNVFAGEVLLIIIGFLAPYVAPVPFLFLEIFVGFIQAFVFAMLTLVFVAIATTSHEGEH